MQLVITGSIKSKELIVCQGRFQKGQSTFVVFPRVTKLPYGSQWANRAFDSSTALAMFFR